MELSKAAAYMDDLRSTGSDSFDRAWDTIRTALAELRTKPCASQIVEELESIRAWLEPGRSIVEGDRIGAISEINDLIQRLG